MPFNRLNILIRLIPVIILLETFVQLVNAGFDVPCTRKNF